MSEVANIPQLRFPGFSDEWEERPLKDVSTFFNGKAYKQAELLSSGKYPVLRVGNFFTNNSWYYSNLELDENKYCDNGDLLYAWSASFGPRIWAGEKVIYHCHIWKVINHSQVTKKFLFIVLDNETAKMKAQSANGFALLHITKGTIENWKINLPPRQEQQKIAAFLAAVDSKIEQLSKKQALLGEYKKGLMQQIFTQEIRFKAGDGSDFPDWEEKKLGDVFEIKAGQSKSKHIKKDGKNIIVDMGGISSEPKLVAKKLTDYDDDFLTTNDLVMPKDDIGGGLIIGKVAEIPENNKYICGDHIYKLTVVNGNITFLKYAINSYQVNKSFRQKANGTAQIGLSRKEVENQLLSFPSLKEQTKIANFLSSIDSKIEQVGKQLNESKQFKKALLQQMFV